MTQTVSARFGDSLMYLRLPDPETEVMPGVRWQSSDHLFTPAYWRSQIWLREESAVRSHRLGDTLVQETAACLLGGHGIPAEVGLAAFQRLRTSTLLGERCPTEEQLFTALSTPLQIGTRQVRYRFARQKSVYLHATLQRLWHAPPPEDDHQQFRAWFLSCPGIGPKTASWITRNWLDSDHVAIIDIHIQRAGQLMGLYTHHQIERHYQDMEDRFLMFAEQLGVRPSLLDAIMWADMKMAGALALDLLRAVPSSLAGRA